jgi:hypothetical protein
MNKTVKPDKKLGEYEQTKPSELSLFDLPGTANQKYSNTIEFYDFMPKYYWGNVKRVNDQFLPRLEREFECKGHKFKLKLDPAKIEDRDGKVRDHYPSQREELVEDALRKIACDGNGVFLDDQASVVFSLYQLQKELKKMGHGYNKNQIKDALLICAGTTIEITSEDGGVFKSHIFETIGLQSKTERGEAFVRFNQLVTTSIRNKTFRQFNYEKSMSYKSVIARQLYKRMSHYYKQAGLMNNYAILLSTIIRDFGLTRYKTLVNNLREVKQALEELKEKDVILDSSFETFIDAKQRNKLIDTKIIITPHPRFCSDIIKANERQKGFNDSSLFQLPTSK